MARLKSRFGWALAGALGIILVLTLARAIQAGPLDPPGPVASTMRTIDELLPSWDKTLASSGGCASQRFTCVMGNAAVLDHETGVVWQRVPSAPSIDFLTAEQTCREAKIGGRYGWRLPTINELLSLDDDSTADSLPAGHPFTNTPDTYLWSQTADASDAQRVQTMTFLNGGGGFSVIARARFGFNAADNARPWCVRGESDASAQQPNEQPAWDRALSATGGCNSARFTCVLPTIADATGEAVLDHETGLVWQRTPSVTPDSWSNSLSRCDERPYGGRMGWRLPQSHELASLVDASVLGPALSLPPGNPFVLGAITPIFWTTSLYGGGSAREAVFFQGAAGQPGTVNLSVNSTNRYWCVRGGTGEAPQ